MSVFSRFLASVIVLCVLYVWFFPALDDLGKGPLHCEDKKSYTPDGKDIWHQRQWELIDHSNSFCSAYETKEDLSLMSGDVRNDLKSESENYEAFWGGIYAQLVVDSKDYIGFVIDSLARIGLAKELSRSELAEMVVGFVQDIPYSYVLNTDCQSHDSGEYACIDNIALGILSPYEFLHSEYGDCDTRAVLIYAILEELDFEPMIVISSQYAHAMLALNIPSAGDHLTYRGKKYYFWETTSKGWPIGVLPPNTNNVDYWKVALVDNTNTAFNES